MPTVYTHLSDGDADVGVTRDLAGCTVVDEQCGLSSAVRTHTSSSLSNILPAGVLWAPVPIHSLNVVLRQLPVEQS